MKRPEDKSPLVPMFFILFFMIVFNGMIFGCALDKIEDKIDRIRTVQK